MHIHTAPHPLPPERSLPSRSGKKERLYLEGLSEAVTTLRVARSDHELVVEQPLPFLRLGAQAHDYALRGGRIASVDVYAKEGVPHLVLHLVYDEPEAVTCLSDDTVPGEVEAPPPSHLHREATVGFETERVSYREVVVKGMPSQRGDETTVVFRTQPGAALARPSLWRRFLTYLETLVTAWTTRTSQGAHAGDAPSEMPAR